MRAGGGGGLAGGGEGMGGTEPPIGKRRSTVNNIHPSPTLSTTEHSHTHPPNPPVHRHLSLTSISHRRPLRETDVAQLDLEGLVGLPDIAETHIDEWQPLGLIGAVLDLRVGPASRLGLCKGYGKTLYNTSFKCKHL